MQDGNELKVEKANEARDADMIAGTTRAQLREHGARRQQGLRAQARTGRRRLSRAGPGQEAEPDARFFAPGRLRAPEGITIETPSQTEIIIRGVDKQQVGQVAAEIRGFRPPEPYKGKGVRYAGEEIDQGSEEEVIRRPSTRAYEHYRESY